MELLKISFSTDALFFSYEKSTKNLSNFINSNNLYNNELLYSFSYVLKNKDKVKQTINKHVKYDFDGNFVYDNEITFNKYIDLINDFNCSKNIVIKSSESLTYQTYKKLLKVKYLSSITCYFMPENFVHSFTVKNVNVYFSFKEKFSKLFVELNNLKDMKNIYYKRNIEVTVDTLKDFELFLKINKHLKLIHIYEYESGIVEKLLDILGSNSYIILIHQNENNLDLLNNDIKKLKELNKKYKKFKGEIKFVFSDDFVKNNLFKQLTYSNLKVCSAIILYLAFVLLISNSYNDYVTWFNSNSIMNSLSTNETISEIIVDNGEESPVLPSDEEVEEDINPYANIPTNLKTLVEMNDDTVGWLSVNNTKINYPVTQSDDNDYYLNRDFYGNRTANGWIFMDYRNNPTNLNKNTVIYGHALLSGYMFGDLRQTIKSSWYKNDENMFITFNTLGVEMKWQVFSIYKTPYTTDYIKVDFFDDEDFLEFVDLIKSRSVYNFGVKVDEDDFVLTLSTCSGNDNGRLVLHAKLVQ